MVRFKRRYLVFRIDWKTKPTTVNFKQISEYIQLEISRQFGDFGAGLSQGQILGIFIYSSHILLFPYKNSYVVIRYLDKSNICIIRVEHSNSQITRYALSRIRQLFNAPCTLNPLLFTGTIRKCEELLIEGSKRKKPV